MLDKASWLPAAERLQIGQSKRVQHDCGEGRTLKISRSNDGYRAYCFRCNDGGSASVPVPSVAERLAVADRLRTADRALPGTPDELPTPASRQVSEWPPGAALWLYKAGLGRDEIGRLGVYYHPPSDRVVLPVPGGFWQARAYQPGRQPKYLGPTPRPPDLLARWGRAEVPTLTEDILSAMKIGTVAEGWAVLGTSVSAHMVASLMRRGTKVNVWLDPDPAGRRGAAKICKQLRAYGLTVRDIVSARDPKLHTRDEIKEILCP